MAQQHISKTRQIFKFDRLESKSRADKDTNWRNKDGVTATNVKEGEVGEKRI